MPLDLRKIKRLREEKKFTQEAAGKLARLGKGWAAAVKWNEIERGRVKDPRLSMLERISSALGVPVDELLRGNHRAKRQKRSLPSGSAGSKALP